MPENNISRSVLLLDASELFPHFREAVVEVCRLLGCRLQSVATLAELQAALTTGKYELAVIDYETLLAERANLPAVLERVPLVAITEFDDLQSRRSAGQLGCMQVLACHYTQEEIAFIFKEVFFSKHHDVRKYPRVMAGLLGCAERGEVVVNGTILNISLGGAFIKCFSSFKEGEVITLQIDIPHESGYAKLHCRGRIVYVKPFYMERTLMVPGMGIEFIDFSDDEAREQLASYVRERLNK